MWMTKRRDRNGLFRIVVDGKWGFADRTGQVVISPRFEAVTDFVEQRAIVTLDGKEGAIDTSGAVAVEPVFDELWEFRGGLAIASRNDLYGYVRSSGQEIVPARHPGAGDLHDDRAGVNVGGKQGLVSNSAVGGKWGFIDSAGRMAIPASFDSVNDFHEGVAIINMGGEQDELGYPTGGQWGLINSAGKFVIEPSPARLFDAEGGAVAAKTEKGSGYYDTSGRPISTFDFEGVGSFSEGLGLATRGGRTGYLNKSGAWAIKPTFESAFEFTNGFAAFAEKPYPERRWGFIDKSGSVVIPPTLAVPGRFRNGFVRVQRERGVYAHVDTKGTFVSDIAFTDVHDFHENVAAVRVGGKLHTISEYESGGEKYTKRVLRGGKWGYMKPDGTWLVEPKFAWAGNFFDGLAEVNVGAKLNEEGYLTGGKRGYIDKNGDYIWEPSS